MLRVFTLIWYNMFCLFLRSFCLFAKPWPTYWEDLQSSVLALQQSLPEREREIRLRRQWVHCMMRLMMMMMMIMITKAGLGLVMIMMKVRKDFLIYITMEISREHGLMMVPRKSEINCISQLLKVHFSDLTKCISQMGHWYLSGC